MHAAARVGPVRSVGRRFPTLLVRVNCAVHDHTSDISAISRSMKRARAIDVPPCVLEAHALKKSFKIVSSLKISFMSTHGISRAGPSDEQDLCHLLAMAFGFDSVRAQEYLHHASIEAFRVARSSDGRAEACAALIKCAHVFGGRAVSAANIAHVAVAPQARGKGIAKPLVDALCQEAKDQGAYLVSLFASARPVYRKCGFELAGSEIVYEADTTALPSRGNAAFDAIELNDTRIAAAYGSLIVRETGPRDVWSPGPGVRARPMAR